MLQLQTLPGSLSGLLMVFRSCFTAPTYRTFVALLAGLVAQPARRTVCGMLIGAGLSRLWHHSRAHWFFARARWSVDQVGSALLALILDRLLAPTEAVVVAVDDTLFHRSGRKVHAAGWHHDGSAKGPKDNRIGWGNCWVIAGVVVRMPFLHRPVCLPVAFSLWPPKSGQSKQAVACRLVERIATACPDRDIHVVADAWYAGMDGASGAARGSDRRARGLPTQVSLTSRLRVNATLHDIAQPIPGARGRPRRIGTRIGKPADLANRSQWTATTVNRYGRTDPVTIAEHLCLWYGVYRSRTIRVILLRDPSTTGYDLALITTDLTSPAPTIITRYAARWSIEVAIEDAKQTTGVGQARNRTPNAVERTVPFGLITQSVVIIWYALHGHTNDVAARRRAEAPWYTTKTQPAYHDMIIKLRRTLIAAKFRAGRPDPPTPEETHAVHLAWAEAAA